MDSVFKAQALIDEFIIIIVPVVFHRCVVILENIQVYMSINSLLQCGKSYIIIHLSSYDNSAKFPHGKFNYFYISLSHLVFMLLNF